MNCKDFQLASCKCLEKVGELSEEDTNKQPKIGYYFNSKIQDVDFERIYNENCRHPFQEDGTPVADYEKLLYVTVAGNSFLLTKFSQTSTLCMYLHLRNFTLYRRPIVSLEGVIYSRDNEGEPSELVIITKKLESGKLLTDFEEVKRLIEDYKKESEKRVRTIVCSVV